MFLIKCVGAVLGGVIGSGALMMSIKLIDKAIVLVALAYLHHRKRIAVVNLHQTETQSIKKNTENEINMDGLDFKDICVHRAVAIIHRCNTINSMNASYSQLCATYNLWAGEV